MQKILNIIIVNYLVGSLSDPKIHFFVSDATG